MHGPMDVKLSITVVPIINGYHM